MCAGMNTCTCASPAQKRADGLKLYHLQIAENVWDLVHSRVRILYNCGRDDDPKATERLRRLARSILKRCSPQELAAGDSGMKVVDAWTYGDVCSHQELRRAQRRIDQVRQTT